MTSNLNEKALETEIEISMDTTPIDSSIISPTCFEKNISQNGSSLSVQFNTESDGLSITDSVSLSSSSAFSPVEVARRSKAANLIPTFGNCLSPIEKNCSNDFLLKVDMPKYSTPKPIARKQLISETIKPFEFSPEESVNFNFSEGIPKNHYIERTKKIQSREKTPYPTRNRRTLERIQKRRFPRASTPSPNRADPEQIAYNLAEQLGNSLSLNKPSKMPKLNFGDISTVENSFASDSEDCTKFPKLVTYIEDDEPCANVVFAKREASYEADSKEILLFEKRIDLNKARMIDLSDLELSDIENE